MWTADCTLQTVYGRMTSPSSTSRIQNPLKLPPETYIKVRISSLRVGVDVRR